MKTNASRNVQNRVIGPDDAIKTYVGVLNTHNFDPSIMALSASSPIPARLRFFKDKFWVPIVPIQHIPTVDITAIATMVSRLPNRAQPPRSEEEPSKYARFFFVWNAAEIYKLLLTVPASYKDLVYSEMTGFLRVTGDATFGFAYVEAREAFNVNSAKQACRYLDELRSELRKFKPSSFRADMFYAELVFYGTTLYEDLWLTTPKPDPKYYLPNTVLNETLLNRVISEQTRTNPNKPALPNVTMYRYLITIDDVRPVLLDISKLKTFLVEAKPTNRMPDLSTAFWVFTRLFAQEQLDRFKDFDDRCRINLSEHQGREWPVTHACIQQALKDFHVRVTAAKDIPNIQSCVSTLLEDFLGLADNGTEVLVVPDSNLEYFKYVDKRLQRVFVGMPHALEVVDKPATDDKTEVFVKLGVPIPLDDAPQKRCPRRKHIAIVQAQDQR